MPGRRRISPDQAILLLHSIVERLTLIALDADQYLPSLESSASMGIVGGTIYDAMLGHCAIKSKAQVIYSFNTRHYALFDDEVLQRVQLPA